MRPRASGAVFGVGHTERYNPAVAAVRPLLDHPRFIEVHRLGTFPDRSLDIDVVFDLMIHDLDVVLSIVPSEVVAVEAVGVAVLTPKPDIANARLKFASGCIANITASRISKDRVRKIRIFQRDAYLSVDYAAQEVERWRLVKGNGAMPAIDGGKLEVAQEEPLKRELADFVAAVRDKRAPGVTGADGLRAIELAQRITDEINRSWRRSRSELQIYMYSDINDFIADLDRRRLLSRIRESVNPDLEIAAVTDRVCKLPGGGPGLLFERPTRLRHACGDESVRLDGADVPRARRARRSTPWRKRSTR